MVSFLRIISSVFAKNEFFRFEYLAMLIQLLFTSIMNRMKIGLTYICL